MRLFTAIELPEAMQQALAQRCFGLPRVRWVDPLQMHLTLVFIGEVNPALKQEICEALTEIPFPAFELDCGGIGSFKSGVLWLGVDESAPLIELQRRIRQSLKSISGISLESRKYHPHITLGRMDRRRPPRLDSFIALNEQDRFSFQVQQFVLKSSLLSAKGASHQIEHCFPCQS